MLYSTLNSAFKAVIKYAKTFNDASRLCFGAATICFGIGAIAWIVNFFVAGTTMLDGLLVVAVFYFALGVIKLFEKQTENPNIADQRWDVDEQTLASQRELMSKTEQLETAA